MAGRSSCTLVQGWRQECETGQVSNWKAQLEPVAFEVGTFSSTTEELCMLSYKNTYTNTIAFLFDLVRS